MDGIRDYRPVWMKKNIEHFLWYLDSGVQTFCVDKLDIFSLFNDSV